MFAVFILQLSAVAFVNDGPIPLGYEVVEDVPLEGTTNDPDDWPIGAAASRGVLGHDPDDPRRFAVFSSARECRHEGFEVMLPNWAAYPDWADFAAKLQL